MTSDDDTEVTDEWLSQMGAIAHNGYGGRWLGTVLCFDRRELSIVGGRLVRPTRGQVRKLCSVFGIELEVENGSSP
jgi:hypothetical protein